MASLDPRDPRNLPGNAPEVSEKDVKLGVYVFQPRNEQDEPIGEKKFLASNDPAHVEAFKQVGYRAATEDEVKEYNKSVAESRKASTSVSSNDESDVDSLKKELKAARSSNTKSSKELEDLKAQLELAKQAQADAEAKLAEKPAEEDGPKEGDKSNDA